MAISDDELAKAMGVSVMAARKLILDKVTLSTSIADKLAKALGTSSKFSLNIQNTVKVWEKRYGP